MVFQPTGSGFMIGREVQKLRARAVLSKNPNRIQGLGIRPPQTAIAYRR